MKQFLLFFFAATLLCQGQIIDFPDPNFKNALLDHVYVIDTNGDGEIQISEAEEYNSVIFIADKNISDLTGIENFIRILQLDVRNNNLSELDLSNLYEVYYIYADNNQLVNINLPNSDRLARIDIANNNLTELDLTSYPNLSGLKVSYNELTSLDLHPDATFNYLECDNNRLTNLDLSGMSGTLFGLNCSNNQLTELDLSMLPNLGLILCANNQLTQLNLHVEPRSLYMLDCSNNQLSTLTVPSNLYFSRISLKCSGNLFTELDLSQSMVTALDCSGNSLLENINWRNGWNYKFDPNDADNNFENLPNLNSVCIDSYNPELMDFILADVGHSVAFYNNETCDALSVNENNLGVLSITPNPAENSIKIEDGTPFNQVDVYNELGQLVLSKTLSTAMAKTTLDIMALGQGLYFVKITDESGNSTIKKVIKN